MASAKLPLNLAALTNGISVSGTAWTIDDEDELARMVGRIFLGHFLHVEKILQKLKPKHKIVDGQAAKEAKARLVVKEGDGTLASRWLNLSVNLVDRSSSSVSEKIKRFQSSPYDSGT